MANKLENELKGNLSLLALRMETDVINLAVPLIVKEEGEEVRITRLEKKGKSWKAAANDRSYTISTFPRCVQLQLNYLLCKIFKGLDWEQTMKYEIKKIFVKL